MSAFLMFVLALLPVTKPNYSGDWALDTATSRLQAPWTVGIESGVVHIEHRDPVFRFQRTFRIRGQESVVAIKITTDGKPQTKTENGVRIRSRMYWEGDLLVFSQLYSQAGSSDATNVVHYELLDEGRTLRSVERVTGSGAYENVWVFHRR